MATARNRPNPPYVAFAAALIFASVLGTLIHSVSRDASLDLFLGFAALILSWGWVAFGRDIIQRAALVFGVSILLATGKILWGLLAGNGFAFILLAGAVPLICYLLLRRFLVSLVQLLWALSLPMYIRFLQAGIWRMLLYTDAPLTSRWIWRIIIRKLRRDTSAEAVKLLADAVGSHPDPSTRLLALEALAQLTDKTAIDTFCAVWSATRHPDLAELLIRKQWRASAPPEILTLSALLLGEIDFLRQSKAEWIPPLAQAALDSDPRIAGRAVEVLGDLGNVEAQEALCRLVAERDNPAAQAAALSAGYLPRGEQERALFLFMTEQWDRYTSHDFDRRLMHLAYLTAPESLQQRIREKLRTLGRIDFLPIIAGESLTERASAFNAGESEVLVQTLSANRDWTALWQRVFDLPFQWSVRAMDILFQSGWKPADDEEQVVFAELSALAAGGLLIEPAEMRNLFPPAIMQSTARVPGRINAVSFAPDRPTLAIGTGQGKVVLWNYQTAKREHILRDFEHSIGEVAFGTDGTLLCAERTNGAADCSIYAFPDAGTSDTSFRLGTHAGSVSALVPLSNSRVLSAGKDANLVLWDLSARSEIRRRAGNDWARNLRVSSDETQLLLLRRGLDLLSLPDLQDLAKVGKSATFRCAAFSPDNQLMFIGLFSGKLLVYQRNPKRNSRLTAQKKPLTQYGPLERVEAVEVLKRLSVLLSAGTGGEIRFFSLDGYPSVGNISVPGGQITSVHISPDESFLAVGSAEATLTLWDLRTLDMRLLLEHPFAQAEVTILPALNAMLGHATLSARARQVLQFAQVILHHRLRYTIEIAEAPSIALGEFDIEID